MIGRLFRIFWQIDRMARFDLAPIERGSLSERAVEALLDHVLTKRLEPGTSLPSADALAATLGVSRPVVREALNALKALGVIEIANGKRAVVRRLDNEVLRIYFRRAVQEIDASLREVMEIRLGIETRAAALAAHHRSGAHLDALKELLGRMEAGKTDADYFSRQDSAFHLAIAEASGNRLILHVVESLETALRTAAYHGLKRIADDAALNAVVVEHRGIVDAIERGDAVGAAGLMQDHITAAVRRMGLGA